MKTKKSYFIIGLFLLVVIFTLVSYFYFPKEEEVNIAIPEVNNEVIANFYVDVKGAVKKPGVYEFVSGDRVFQAIEKAGGLTQNAETSNINLSQKLVSEMVVYVFTKTEVKNGAKSINCATKCNCQTLKVNNCYPSENEKININLANLEDLLKLSGIGESKAKAIISYREEKGLFKNIEELLNVSGIGQSLFDNIKDNITI